MARAFQAALLSKKLDDGSGSPCWLPFITFSHLNDMQVMTRIETSLPTQYRVRTPAEPMPPPIKEPPEPMENPDAPVREPDPEEPEQI